MTPTREKVYKALCSYYALKVLFSLLECRDLGDVFGMDCGPAVESEVLCLNETFIDLCPRSCGFCEKKQKIVFDPSGKKMFLQWSKKRV